MTGQPKIATSFLPVTAHSATTEAAGFPRENAVDRTSPMRAWRSTTVAEDQRFVVDLGEAKTDISVFMDWVNFTAFKYQESADGESSWADVGGERTVEMDSFHGVYRRRDYIALTSKRYLGILIPAQSPFDGTGSFRIGTVCIPDGVVEIAAETLFEYPLKYLKPRTHIRELRNAAGRLEQVRLTELEPMIISLSVSTEVFGNLAGAPLAQIAALFRADAEMMYIDMNLGQSWQAYLVKRTGELGAEVGEDYGEADLGIQTLEVVV